jgi:hypothetical protein
MKKSRFTEEQIAYALRLAGSQPAEWPALWTPNKGKSQGGR